MLLHDIVPFLDNSLEDDDTVKKSDAALDPEEKVTDIDAVDSTTASTSSVGENYYSSDITWDTTPVDNSKIKDQSQGECGYSWV